jgi:hypothetical protein
MGFVACVRELRNTYRIVMENRKRNRPFVQTKINRIVSSKIIVREYDDSEEWCLLGCYPVWLL